ncbi:MAG: acyl carrier protein [Methylococcales bacterium]|jgi:acyl carrier protein|nr:acyl carrier protein [Methylococcales bacterium]MBT7445918.1 acyl carrier protein [Methylococcales bacterium]
MTKDEIFSGVQEIFRDIFDEDDLVIQDSTSSEDIEDWDSLNHINLVSAIEKEFKIKFALGELVSLQDVGEMITLMIEKMK